MAQSDVTKSSNDKFVNASIEVDKSNDDKVIQILTEILEDKTEQREEFLMLVYKQRANAHYNLDHFREAAQDIDDAVKRGFILSVNEKFFYMYNHCVLERDLNKVIKNFEEQNQINSEWECCRVIKLLKNIKLSSIFIRASRREHERSQSCDRNKTK